MLAFFKTSYPINPGSQKRLSLSPPLADADTAYFLRGEGTTNTKRQHGMPPLTLPLPKGLLGLCHFLGGERGALCGRTLDEAANYQVIETAAHLRSWKALLQMKVCAALTEKTG